MIRIVFRYWFVKLAGIICSMVLVCSCLAALTDSQPASTEESLKQFLQAWDDDMSTQYITAFHDLNADGIPDAIVYLTGRKWCGSGGCTTLILKQAGHSWQIVTKITLTRRPIRVLEKVSNGWHSIGVWVQGGGIKDGYESELNFDGISYPKNPTVTPARRLNLKSEGVVVITSPELGH
jgi:hypothetical protein